MWNLFRIYDLFVSSLYVFACWCFMKGVVFMGFWFLVLRLALVLFVLGVEVIALDRLINCIKDM